MHRLWLKELNKYLLWSYLKHQKTSSLLHPTPARTCKRMTFTWRLIYTKLHNLWIPLHQPNGQKKDRKMGHKRILSTSINYSVESICFAEKVVRAKLVGTKSPKTFRKWVDISRQSCELSTNMFIRSTSISGTKLRKSTNDVVEIPELGVWTLNLFQIISGHTMLKQQNFPTPVEPRYK